MEKLKRLYPVPFFAALFFVFLHSSYHLIFTGFFTAWLGSFVAVVPYAFFGISVIGGGKARTRANPPSLWIWAVAGSFMAIFLPESNTLSTIYALGIGLTGSLVYLFWYSSLGNRSDHMLLPGNKLPDFSLQDQFGNVVTTSDICMQPSIMLFYRGNWCPLCVAQITELAERYKELSARGIKVYLISSQSQNNTRDLAKKFDVPMDFLVDKNCSVARQLGILHENGVPLGVSGYDSDTTMPTALITDKNGRIIFADLTDNYRVRPDPDTFMRILDQSDTII